MPLVFTTTLRRRAPLIAVRHVTEVPQSGPRFVVAYSARWFAGVRRAKTATATCVASRPGRSDFADGAPQTVFEQNRGMMANRTQQIRPERTIGPAYQTAIPGCTWLVLVDVAYSVPVVRGCSSHVFSHRNVCSTSPWAPTGAAQTSLMVPHRPCLILNPGHDRNQNTPDVEMTNCNCNWAPHPGQPSGVHWARVVRLSVG